MRAPRREAVGQPGVTWNSAVPPPERTTSIKAVPTVPSEPGAIVTVAPSAVNVTPASSTAAIAMTGLEPQENVVCPFTVVERALVPELLIDEPPDVSRTRQNPEADRGVADGEARGGDGEAWPDGAPGRGVGSPLTLVVHPATTSAGSVTATSTEPNTRIRTRSIFTRRIVPSSVLLGEPAAVIRPGGAAPAGGAADRSLPHGIPPAG
jgi:hypothetical protein